MPILVAPLFSSLVTATGLAHPTVCPFSTTRLSTRQTITVIQGGTAQDSYCLVNLRAAGRDLLRRCYCSSCTSWELFGLAIHLPGIVRGTRTNLQRQVNCDFWDANHIHWSRLIDCTEGQRVIFIEDASPNAGPDSTLACLGT
jgi:hypothetical protein